MQRFSYMTYRLNDETIRTTEALLERLGKDELLSQFAHRRDKRDKRKPDVVYVTVPLKTHNALKEFFHTLTLDDVHKAFHEYTEMEKEIKTDLVFQFYFIELLKADVAMLKSE